MSTRSSIAIKHEDGSIDAIYCHNDGYLTNNGVILYKNYQDPAKVQQLINLGSISSLGIVPNQDPDQQGKKASLRNMVSYLTLLNSINFHLMNKIRSGIVLLAQLLITVTVVNNWLLVTTIQLRN